MARLRFVDVAGRVSEVAGEAGDSVMKAATAAGITGVYAECGGEIMCATCHVYVAESDLAVFDEAGFDEDEMLEATATERLPNSRLSCCLVVPRGDVELTFHLPESQR